jgi:hypothetical protein
MFKKQAVLRHQTHGKLKLSATVDWGFTSNQMLCPIVLNEIANCAREFPIVFIKDRPTVYALLGVEKDTNAYVSAKGVWQANYIPAHFRAYPFDLVRVPNKDGEYALIIDEQSQQVQNGHQPLFEGETPSNALKARIDLLHAIKREEAPTAAIVATLHEHDLLIDRGIRVRRDGEERTPIGGLQVVDEKKLNALSDAAFNALRKEGALPLIYAHLLSMANLRQGVIAGKGFQASHSDQQLQFSNNETIKFN